MARKPRIHFPGAVYHVILRGNAGHPVFFDDADRYRFYLYLQYAVEKFGCRIHNFCLMTNHIHLIARKMGSEQNYSLGRHEQNSERSPIFS
jgi:REP element-mobilizing transposase RayT